MDCEEVGEIHTVVLDVQSSTKHVLRKLTQLVDQPYSTSCHDLHQEIKTEITSIRDIIQSIKSNGQTTKRKVTQLEAEIRVVKSDNRLLRDQIEALKYTSGFSIDKSGPSLSTKHDEKDDESSDDDEEDDDKYDNNDDGNASAIDIKHTKTTRSHVTTYRCNDSKRQPAQTQGQCYGKETHARENNNKKTNTDEMKKQTLENSAHLGSQSGRKCDLNYVKRKLDRREASSSATGDEQKHLACSDGALAIQHPAKGRDMRVSFTVAEQTTKEYHLTTEVWTVQANAERRLGMPLVADKKGAFTVLLVDTSASILEDNAWHETDTFVRDYISGLEKMATMHGCDDEYVSLVTFGSQTRCQQRFTNNLKEITDKFAQLTLGGPSPMSGGIEMTQCVVLQPEDPIFEIKSNGIFVTPKVVILTDGYATDNLMHRGPDEVDPTTLDQTHTSILRHMEHLSKNPGVEIVCVPVGRANTDFLDLMCNCCHGKIVSFRDGNQLARRLMLSRKILPPVRLGFLMFVNARNERIPFGDSTLTQRDMASIREILEVSEIEQEFRRKKNEIYEELDDVRLPPIGTRVRRGPNWDSDDQDNDGPGTVIGHFKDWNGIRVWVLWDGYDTPYRHDYGYGYSEQYSVWPVDEPRVLLPGQPLDVGCVVTPGKDYAGNLVKSGDKGVVLHVALENGKRKALVRWDNGKRGRYAYGVDRIFEVRMCDATEAASWKPQHRSADTDGQTSRLQTPRVRTHTHRMALPSSTEPKPEADQSASTVTMKKRNKNKNETQ